MLIRVICDFQVPPPPNTVTLIQNEGCSLHIESDEAQKQIIEMGTGMTITRQLTVLPLNKILSNSPNKLFDYFQKICFFKHF